MSEPLAVLVSDLHLSAKAPPGRAEKDAWYEVQRGHLRQVRRLCHANRCPLVIAGDVFDAWDAPPELITFAVEEFDLFPGGLVFAVPGQHDLPYHRYGDRGRGAYGTLVAAGVVKDLRPDVPFRFKSGLVLHAFPWEHPVRPLRFARRAGDVHVAVVHQYVWTEACKYPNAPPDKSVDVFKKAAGGYDLVLVGDNHKNFRSGRVFNHGTFVERKRDERGAGPAAGVIWSDGRLTLHPLDTSQDVWLPADEEVGAAPVPDAGAFVAAVRGLGDGVPDFFDACRRAAEDPAVGDSVRADVFDILEAARPR